jgi:hypothetical protein
MNNFNLKYTWEIIVVRLINQTVESDNNKGEYDRAFEPLLSLYDMTTSQWARWQTGIFNEGDI